MENFDKRTRIDNGFKFQPNAPFLDLQFVVVHDASGQSEHKRQPALKKSTF